MKAYSERPESMSYLGRRDRALEDYPDYCSVVDASRMLGMTKQSVTRHRPHLGTIIVDGVHLYHTETVKKYAKKRRRAVGGALQASRMSFFGIDVERLQTICEVYYRTHLDTAPEYLLALAKKVARL